MLRRKGCSVGGGIGAGVRGCGRAVSWRANLPALPVQVQPVAKETDAALRQWADKAPARAAIAAERAAAEGEGDEGGKKGDKKKTGAAAGGGCRQLLKAEHC